MDKIVTYMDVECRLKFYKYGHNDNTCMGLETLDGEEMATITTNFAMKQPENIVVTKTWGENEGMLEFLLEEGIVGKPINYIESGFVQAPVCPLLIKPVFEEFEE